MRKKKEIERKKQNTHLTLEETHNLYAFSFSTNTHTHTQTHVWVINILYEIQKNVSMIFSLKLSFANDFKIK